MKLLVLCRESRLYSCQRLKQAAEKRGYKLDIFDPNRFLMKLTEGKFQLYYHIGESYQKDRPDPFPLCNYLGVFARFGTTSTDIGCHLLRHFEGKGIATQNSSQGFRLARDKWQSLQRLVANHIPIPNSLMAGHLFGIKERFQHFSFPNVIKTLSGSQGVGVMLSESASSGQSVLETLQSANIPTLQQQFIREANGTDIRAFVVGGNVVATMQRQSHRHNFRANIHQGGTAQTIQLSEEEQQLAVNAAQAIGLDIAGVDLIRSTQGLLVLEVNANPGLEMIEQVSQVDIAGEMVEHLLKHIHSQ